VYTRGFPSESSKIVILSYLFVTFLKEGSCVTLHRGGKGLHKYMYGNKFGLRRAPTHMRLELIVLLLLILLILILLLLILFLFFLLIVGYFNIFDRSIGVNTKFLGHEHVHSLSEVSGV